MENFFFLDPDPDLLEDFRILDPDPYNDSSGFASLLTGEHRERGEQRTSLTGEHRGRREEGASLTGEHRENIIKNGRDLSSL